MKERIQKVLARAGLGSRREIEKWIEQGIVIVNGKVAQLGDRADEKDRITIKGRRVRISGPLRCRILAYHKPAGEVTTRKDPEGRPTVFQNLPHLNKGRWVAVGRLDINTSGLLLFTNDGGLANLLMHPSQGVEREYAVRIYGQVTEAVITLLKQGVKIDDGMARFEQIEPAGGTGVNQWFHVVLSEGRHREVRRLWESQGVLVSRLIRIRYGPIQLERGLKSGRWRELARQQSDALYTLVGLKPPSVKSTPNKSSGKKSLKRRPYR